MEEGRMEERNRRHIKGKEERRIGDFQEPVTQLSPK